MTEPQIPRPSLPSIDDALAQLDEERRRLDTMQGQLAQASTTVQTKDRLLSVTVDGRGDLVKLTFHGSRYQRLAPGELAGIIVDTVSTARKQAVAKMGEMLGTDPLPGIGFGELANGTRAFSDVLDSFLGAALEQLPEQVRSRVGKRLEYGGT